MKPIEYIKNQLMKVWESRGTNGTAVHFNDRITNHLKVKAALQRRSVDEVANELVSFALDELDGRNKKLHKKWDSLTDREKDIVALACLGHTNQEMGKILSLAEGTIKTHLRNALQKFKLRSKSQIYLVLENWDFSEWDKPDLS